MSILDTNRSWGLPISEDYSISWVNTGGFPADVRDLISKMILDRLDANPDKYRTMIEAGSLHSIYCASGGRAVPEQYSVNICKEYAQMFLREFSDIIPECPYIQITFTQQGSGYNTLIPSLTIQFDYNEFDPWWKNSVIARHRINIYIKQHRYVHYNDIIPNFLHYPTAYMKPTTDIYVKNF